MKRNNKDRISGALMMRTVNDIAGEEPRHAEGIRRIIPILVVALTVLFSGALDARAQSVYYVRAGATGANSGSDWNNAYKALPAALVRGATYYIADGSYGSYTFDDSHSGGALIAIKKATPTDHGTENGWSHSYGDGQAVFGSLHFSRGYYTIDGVTGGGPGSWESGFGLTCRGVSSDKYVDNNSDHITIRHVDVNVGSSGAADTRAFEIWGHDYFTIEYCYIHDVGMDIFSMNAMNKFLLQYSKIARNYQNAAYHGDIIEYQVGNANDFTVRYNIFEDVVGSYGFGSHDPIINGYYVYGNIFYFTKNCFFGNGLIGCLSGGGTLTNFKFYNNTIAGVIGDGGYGLGFGRMGGTGNEARNNLIYRKSGSTAHSWASVATSSNTAYNMGTVANENLSGNPFSNFPSSFALSAGSTEGTALASPYNEDMLGNIRGSDGRWDRGALEFGPKAALPAVVPPENVRVIRN